MKQVYENCIVLLMGFAGTGKLTVAQALAKTADFRLVDNHTWCAPIFNLLQRNEVTPLPELAWQKAGEMCNILFSTIRELSPLYFSFIFTQEMIEGDEYPKIFYQKIVELAKYRRSTFLPIRLICEKNELIQRVQQPQRQDRYKTMDAKRASRQSKEQAVFYSHHPHEITIDNTHQSPEMVARIILEQLKKIKGNNHD